MVEAYKGEDADVDSSEDTDSSSEEDEAVPTPPVADATAAFEIVTDPPAL